MPRRYYAYLDDYTLLHQVSTIGALTLGAGLFVTLFTLIHATWWGTKAAGNYYQGVSLEWTTSSPPIEHNFHDTPHVTGSPYDFPEIDTSEPGHH